MTSTRLRSLLVALLVSFGLLAAACGDDDTGSADAPTTSQPPTTAAMEEPDDDMNGDDTASGMDDMNGDDMAVGGEFGAACAAVPADGAGSFSGMAQDPVATAASNNPVLSTLVTAVVEAGLVDTLNSGGPWTVFAPANDAFAAIPEADLQAVLADTDLLTSILTYHVVEGRIAPEDLAGTVDTVNGASLDIEGSGETFTVNGANVVCGNVQTANATVYIVDAVLMPPS